MVFISYSQAGIKYKINLASTGTETSVTFHSLKCSFVLKFDLH